MKRIKVEEVELLPDEVEALKKVHEYLPLEEVEKPLSKPYSYALRTVALQTSSLLGHKA